MGSMASYMADEFMGGKPGRLEDLGTGDVFPLGKQVKAPKLDSAQEIDAFRQTANKLVASKPAPTIGAVRHYNGDEAARIARAALLALAAAATLGARSRYSLRSKPVK